MKQAIICANVKYQIKKFEKILYCYNFTEQCSAYITEVISHHVVNRGEQFVYYTAPCCGSCFCCAVEPISPYRVVGVCGQCKKNHAFALEYKKSHPVGWLFFTECVRGGVLLSHTLPSAVPSPCRVLASRFGMETGHVPRAMTTTEKLDYIFS